MIGRKKLSTIRQELESALAATGEDPIRWLEEQMTVAGQGGTTAPDESEILHSLRRILETTGSSRRRKQRTGSKK